MRHIVWWTWTKIGACTKTPFPSDFIFWLVNHSGILRVKTNDSLNGWTCSSPSAATLVAACRPLREGYEADRRYFCDFIIRSFLKVTSHPSTHTASDLQTISGLVIAEGPWPSVIIQAHFSSEREVFLATQFQECVSELPIHLSSRDSVTSRSTKEVLEGQTILIDHLAICPWWKPGQPCFWQVTAIPWSPHPRNLNIHSGTKEAISTAPSPTFIPALWG